MSRGAFNLSTVEDRHLWVQSGGLCAKCKTPLILDDINEKVNIGERAHIIGKSKGKKGGPRREFAEKYEYSDDNIDSLTNLMLMCSPCHHTIDTNEKAYPPDFLFDLKKSHEEWVQTQLSIKNKAIAVIHKRKNNIPIDSLLLGEEAKSLLLDAVVFQKEFKDFTEEGWESAKKENEDFFSKVVQSKKDFDGALLYLFPLSPISLLIHLGKLISDTIPVVIYQFDRDTQKWCNELNEAEVSVKTTEVTVTDEVHRSLVVTVQVSGAIQEKDIKDAVGDTYQHLDIKVDDPHLTAVLYQHDVEFIRKSFRNELYRLQNKNHYSDIHLFYYGPAGLAVELGRCINDTILPIVQLYEFNNRRKKKYHRSITV